MKMIKNKKDSSIICQYF